MGIAADNKRKEQQAMAAMERAKQEHTKRLKQMQIDAQERDKKSRIAQKNANVANITAEVNKLNSLIDADKSTLESSKQLLQTSIRTNKSNSTKSATLCN